MADEMSSLRFRYSRYKQALVGSSIGTIMLGIFALSFGLDSLEKGVMEPMMLFGGMTVFAAFMTWFNIRTMARIRRRLATLSAAKTAAAG